MSTLQTDHGFQPPTLRDRLLGAAMIMAGVCGGLVLACVVVTFAALVRW